MKISITRALVELKRYDQRINQALSGAQFVTVAIGKNQKKRLQNNQQESEFTANAVASSQKIQDLIQNRQKLKASIVASNASTMVQILNDTMTVAEAIELKNSVTYLQNARNLLSQQLAIAKNSVDKINSALDAKIETSLNTVYGSEKAKVDEATYDAVAKPLNEAGFASIVDPINAAKQIEELDTVISAIESELDFVLSESNAKTEIEVDLS